MRVRRPFLTSRCFCFGLASVVLLGGAACSGTPPMGMTVPGWPKPPPARVTAAVRLAYPTHATCREADEQYHDYDQSTWECTEHPRHCDAPGDTVGMPGCWAISCDVHMAVTSRIQGTLDFYNCHRYNGDCHNVVSGCPPGRYVCVDGRGRKLQVDPYRLQGAYDDDPCPFDNEVHPDS
jgi:hypothetical protein